MRSLLRPLLLPVVVALAALLGPISGAGAAATGTPPPIEREEKPFDGFFYGDFDAELLLLAGEPYNETSCVDKEFPLVTKRYRERRDGTWVERWQARQRLTLYSTPLGGPEYEEQQCTAIGEGADAPEPFATGRGRVRSYVDGLASKDGPPTPGTRIVNSTWGIVSDEDGMSYLVRSRADLELDENLAPVGSPTEFQWLRVMPLRPLWWR